MNSFKRNGLFAGILLLPMLAFFSSYLWYHEPGYIPTGFIQYDNAGYVAYAKQYLDAENSTLFYSNPFNDSENYGNIYFQVQTLLIAFGLKAGIPGDLILIIFTLVCSFSCILIIIALFDHLAPNSKYRKLSILFFTWGGGLLVAGSTLLQLSGSSDAREILSNLYILDPGGGWWGLNLGRALFFSCEAFYHLLFLSSILCILRKKWVASLLLTLLLSVSHPFTGTQLLCILGLFIFTEKIILKNKNIPWYYFIGILLVSLLHFVYYIYFQNQFTDHRSVREQYSLNWYIRFAKMIPAYAIVGLLAGYSYFKTKNAFLKSLPNRLFLCWFIVSLLLAKHELFIKPMQPIHFTRGYIWTSLFLIGIPGLHLFLQYCSRHKTVMIGFCILFLLDNAVWISQYALSRHKGTSISYITNEEKNVLNILREDSTEKTLIIGHSDEYEAIIPYLSLVETKAYTWYSHPFTTPYARQKKEAYLNFIRSGQIDEKWKNRDLVIIFRKHDVQEMKRLSEFPFTYKTLSASEKYTVISLKIID